MKSRSELLKEAILKYKDRIKLLQDELIAVEKLRASIREGETTITDLNHLKMTAKGCNLRKKEIENEIHDIYVKIGRLSIQETELEE